jgi:hypothetical protein
MTRLTARQAARRNKRETNVKVYVLANRIPAHFHARPEGAGGRILASIARHRMATAKQIRQDMPSGFSDATLRFYLGKFQQDGTILA